MNDRWYLKQNKENRDWEFWLHCPEEDEDSAGGATLQFSVVDASPIGKDRSGSDSIDKKRAEEICRGLNLMLPDSKRAESDSMDTPATAAAMERDGFRTMSGIADRIYTVGVCCCCGMKFENLKIYGMSIYNAAVICGTCRAKYDLAKSSATAVRALETLDKLLANTSDDGRWREIKPILQRLIDLGKPVEMLTKQDKVNIATNTRIDRERELLNMGKSETEQERAE